MFLDILLFSNIVIQIYIIHIIGTYKLNRHCRYWNHKHIHNFSEVGT